MEVELIRRTKLPFAPSARLLYHLICAQEGDERWLFFCPAGTHPMTDSFMKSLDPNANVSFFASSDPNTDLAYIAWQLGTKDVGKLRPEVGGPAYFQWNSKGQWDVKITSVDRGDYVEIQHTWKEVRVGGRWVNSEDVGDICP